jgi:hypothetical protein
MAYLTADELLAGSALTHDVPIPPSVIGADASGHPTVGEGRVRMRPLTVRDIQRATKAAREDDALLSILMLKEGIVEPSLSLDQVHGLHAGLARFLLDELNRISGLTTDEGTLSDAVHAPMARACFALAQSFGWSPQEVGELTLGQVLLYLEMLGSEGADGARAGLAYGSVP